MDPIYEAYLSEAKEATLGEFYIAVAEYMGSNEPLDVKRFSKFLKPYVKSYRETYRWWMNTSYDPDKKFKPKLTNKYLATTNDLDVVEEMIRDLDASGTKYIVTGHWGKGIYLNSILKDALKFDLGKNNNFVKGIYQSYRTQEEILMLPPYGKMEVIGYWDAEEDEIALI
jgi:hypothetical protein